MYGLISVYNTHRRTETQYPSPKRSELGPKLAPVLTCEKLLVVF